MCVHRCRGVEHFLLAVLEDAPDLELLINVLDYPQVCRCFAKGGYSQLIDVGILLLLQTAIHRAPLPIMSFSKVRVLLKMFR